MNDPQTTSMSLTMSKEREDYIRAHPQWHDHELLAEIDALRSELLKLQQPPDNDAWIAVIKHASLADGDGVLKINQITTHYNAMRAELQKAKDALAESQSANFGLEEQLSSTKFSLLEASKELVTIQKMYDKCFKERDEARARWVLDPIHIAHETLEQQLAQSEGKDYAKGVAILNLQEMLIKVEDKLAQSEKVAETLAEELENCKSALNRVTGVLIEQAKIGRYPESLIGEGWKFATDAVTRSRNCLELYAAHKKDTQPRGNDNANS